LHQSSTAPSKALPAILGILGGLLVAAGITTLVLYMTMPVLFQIPESVHLSDPEQLFNTGGAGTGNGSGGAAGSGGTSPATSESSSELFMGIGVGTLLLVFFIIGIVLAVRCTSPRGMH
jgi:hypothetical protein